MAFGRLIDQRRAIEWNHGRAGYVHVRAAARNRAASGSALPLAIRVVDATARNLESARLAVVASHVG
jgi:hypothetical protein